MGGGVSPPSPFFGPRRCIRVARLRSRSQRARLLKRCSFRHSSRKRPLNDLTCRRLRGLAGLNEAQADAAPVRPCHHGPPTEFPIHCLCAKMAWSPAGPRGDPQHATASPPSARAGHGHGFRRRVVHDRALLSRRPPDVRSKTKSADHHRIRRLRLDRGCRSASGIFLASTPHLQTLRHAQPLYPLVIDAPPAWCNFADRAHAVAGAAAPTRRYARGA